MHWTRFVLFVLIPLLVDASPTALSRRSNVVPLSKRLRITENGRVNIAVLNQHVSKITGKVSQGFRNFKKNTGSFHPNDRRVSFHRRTSGADKLTDDSNSLWHGTIQVGTPAESFTVDFDTGSSDLFLPDVNCQVDCQGHKLYNAAKSTSSINRGRQFSLSFGDGSSVAGDQWSDVISIAGFKATRQRIGAALQYSDGFAAQTFPPDGLMGMGFREISGYPASPLFLTLVRDNQTDEPIFAFKLAANDSELFVGGVNKEKFVGDITEVKVSPVGFWQVEMNSIEVKGKPVASHVGSIIDTGTTLIMGDPKTVQAVYAAIPGAKDASATAGPGFFTFPCDSNPSVSVNFGGKSFAISPDTFSLGPLSPRSSDCVGGIVASSDLPFWILGDVFLQNVYTVFNTGNQTVGFADLAPNVGVSAIESDLLGGIAKLF